VSGYTPLFDSLTTGTLCGRWPDIGLWPIVLSLSDSRGIVDVTPAYLSRVTGLPEAEVVACMERFCQPDPYSRTRTADGARLELIDEHRTWGWRVINKSQYREKARKMAYDQDRTASGEDAARKRAERANASGVSAGAPTPSPTSPAANAVPTRPDASRDLPPSDTETDADTETITRNARASASGAVAASEYVGDGPSVPRETFDRIRRCYPKGTYREANWQLAEREIGFRIDEGEKPADLVAAAGAYGLQQTSAGNVGTRFVMAPQRFYGREGHWRGPFNLEQPSEKDQRVAALADWQRVLTFVRAGDYHRGKTMGGRLDVVVRKIGGFQAIGLSNTNDASMRNRFVEAWLDTSEAA